MLSPVAPSQHLVRLPLRRVPSLVIGRHCSIWSASFSTRERRTHGAGTCAKDKVEILVVISVPAPLSVRAGTDVASCCSDYTEVRGAENTMRQMIQTGLMLFLGTYIFGLAGCTASRAEAACSAMGGHVVDTLAECCCDCLDCVELDDGRICFIDYWPNCPPSGQFVDAGVDATLDATLDATPDAE